MATSPQPAEPEFSIEPVLGWRAWQLNRVDGVLTLGSLTQSTTWPPGEVMEARCTRRHGTTVPIQGCTCGLYAAASAKDLAGTGILNTSVAVVGAIAMWGTVVEHQRGARSRFAYPARLRLVCGPCLNAGAGAVDPVHVVEPGGNVRTLCAKHSQGMGPRAMPADEVQAELLATYGVELMPIERIERDLRMRSAAARTAASDPTRLVGMVIAGIGKVLGALFMLWAFSGFLLLGVGLLIGVYQFVGRAVGFVPPEATPVVRVAPPEPPSIEVWRPRAPAGPIATDLPQLTPGRQLLTPGFAPFALLCGRGDGMRIDVVPCEEGTPAPVWGVAVREAPHGPATDCTKGWDAYAHGRRFWICWFRFGGAPELERWAHSSNPWSIPVDEGGPVHEHR